jgi:hypothetical protein
MTLSPERLPERLPDKPDVRPPMYLWLTVSLALTSLLAVAGMLGQVYGGAEIIPRLDRPLRVIFVILVILLVLNTIRFIPRAHSPARRRLPLLLLLAVPWLAALAGGPLGFVEISHVEMSRDPLLQQRVLNLQYGAFIASVLLPFALLIFMRGARRFTLSFGALNLLVCFFIVAVGSTLAQPGA